MSKRFTDTGKWDKAWIRKLKPKMKCVWFFLCDRCDHAGIWELDEGAFAYYIGEQISLDEILEVFGDRIQILENDKLFIKSFIDFQYGELNPENRVHKSVIDKLAKMPSIKPLTSPLQGSMDKDKDKYKDKDKDKDKDKEKELQILKTFSFNDAYSLYIVKSKGQKAEANFYAQIKTDDDFAKLVRSIENYKKYLADPDNKWRRPKQSFSAYLGSKTTGYFWHDWIDYVHIPSQPKQSSAQAVFDTAREQIARIERGEL
jgi:hypothetical protein